MLESGRIGVLGHEMFGLCVTNGRARASSGLVARFQEERSDGNLLGAVVAGDSGAFPRMLGRFDGALGRRLLGFGDDEIHDWRWVLGAEGEMSFAGF